MLPQLTTGFSCARRGIQPRYSITGAISPAAPPTHTIGFVSVCGDQSATSKITAGPCAPTTGWLAKPSPTTIAARMSQWTWFGVTYHRTAKYVASAETSAPSAYTRAMPDWLHRDALNAHVRATAAATYHAKPSVERVRQRNTTERLEHTAENRLSRSAGMPTGTRMLKSFPSSTYSGYPGGCGMPTTCTAAASSPLSPT